MTEQDTAATHGEMVAADNPPLLQVDGLCVSIGNVRPVDGVSFHIHAGECVGLVGESGCGKSLTAMTITGLTRAIPGSRISGQILWQAGDGAALDLALIKEAELARVRGAGIGMVFQDPLACLNPLIPVGEQVAETIRAHCSLRHAPLRQRVMELLVQCGVPQPEVRMRQYPHQLSGGLRQRVLMAVALAAGPRLLIADEPTTALDVTVQAQVLATLRKLIQDRKLSVLFITHDLAVVSSLCSRVLVMYAGRIVEESPAGQFFKSPQHPYSRGLLASLPSCSVSAPGSKQPLKSIPGQPPKPGAFPTGCRYHPRCPYAVERCRVEAPQLIGEPGRLSACWLGDQIAP